MLSDCANLVIEERYEKEDMDTTNMSGQDIIRIILCIKDKILREPQLVLLLNDSSSQKAIELVDKNAQ
ncbi:MAG: hypothetical protein QMD92_02380 [bacterium]|nr:hypothetical protein [bacterium]